MEFSPKLAVFCRREQSFEIIQREDADVLVLAYFKNLLVSGYQVIGFRGECGLQDRIIVGIARHKTGFKGREVNFLGETQNSLKG